MKLRRWQAECVTAALSKYRRSRRFLCMATPGAGKSTMAAEVTAQLFETDQIDFALCFSPSLSVAEGLREAFSRRLKKRFDGRLGAAGCSYTYQSMAHLSADFWALLLDNRVLVVFDEIHHCSGSGLDNANAWGEEILLNIQSQASFILTLSGTPWRSDRMPVALFSYGNEYGQVDCDYIYGLREAVQDGVCRIPKIVLLDNERVQVAQDDGAELMTFASFEQLFTVSRVKYRALVTHEPALRHILHLGCERLAMLRGQDPRAGGLVVASSVQHAIQIMELLQAEFGQSAVLVTYKQPDAHETISRYRRSDKAWIVSVGMVSEGTDIPRLQVCLHLSHVRTELHFRQVLGRILRGSGANSQEAWLYTFAEPALVEFANRIHEDLPQCSVIQFENLPGGKMQVDDQPTDTDCRPEGCLEELAAIPGLDTGPGLEVGMLVPLSRKDSPNISLQLLGGYREKVIASFDSPFTDTERSKCV